MGLFFIAFVSAAESLLTSWWQVVLVIAVSFVGIAFCWSMYRFRLMIQNLNVPDQVSPGEGMDFFQAMVAQKISAIHSHTEFGVGVIRSSEMGSDELYQFIKANLRAESDGVIRLNGWVGIIIFGEREAMDQAFARWSGQLESPLLAGAAFYPDYGHSSKSLIEAAETAMQQVSLEEGGLIWAEAEEEAEPEEKPAESIDEEEEIESDSSLDPLTGVLAMHKVASYMRKYLGEYRRTHQLALFFIGINAMDDIEDIHGKEAGDAVRKALSALIQSELREDDVIGRYDEDEFLALMLCDEQHVSSIAKRLRDRSLKLVVNHHNRRIKVTVNIGVSICPRHGRNLANMFAAAKGAYDIAKSRQGSMALIAGEA